MWEALKTLMELVQRASELIGRRDSRRREQKHLDIGYDLFMLYSRMNQILVIGDTIVRWLEEFVEADGSWFSRTPTLPHGFKTVNTTFQDSSGERGIVLEDLVRSQIQAIDSIWGRLMVLREEVTVIDSAFYRDALTLFDLKRGHLGFVLHALRRNMLPLTKPTDGPDVLREQLFRFDTGPYLPQRLPLTTKNQKAIRRHLDEHHPRQVLDEIARALQDFRDKLEQHFSIADVLSRVRDERIKDEPNWRS